MTNSLLCPVCDKSVSCVCTCCHWWYCPDHILDFNNHVKGGCPGFCVVEDDCVTCLGERFSLNIGHKEDDSEIATLQVFGLESAIDVKDGKTATHTILKEAKERLYVHNVDPLSQRLDEKSPDFAFLKLLSNLTD